MSVIVNIGKAYSSLPPLPVAGNHPVSERLGGTTRNGDRVELSEPCRALSRVVDDSNFRLARVRAIRSEIAAGTYETPDRINGTVSRLLDVIA